MAVLDEAATLNSDFWEQEVRKDGGHTIPWLDLDRDALQRYLRGEQETLVGRRDPRRGVNIPAERINRLGDVRGKAVLCLSCGGGQQSALFGLLGANVTVVDLAEGQLKGDQEAAAHHGYRVRTVHGDMRDLSGLENASFDIVFGMTPCYVPSLGQVYSEVSRVLKPGGLYSTDMTKPGLFDVGWDGEGYRINKPYGESVQRREDGAVEFRHYLDDIFNGLTENGLTLVHVEDNARHRTPGPDVLPGSYKHECDFVGGGFTVLAKKQGS